MAATESTETPKRAPPVRLAETDFTCPGVWDFQPAAPRPQTAKEHTELVSPAKAAGSSGAGAAGLAVAAAAAAAAGLGLAVARVAGIRSKRRRDASAAEAVSVSADELDSEASKAFQKLMTAMDGSWDPASGAPVHVRSMDPIDHPVDPKLLQHSLSIGSASFSHQSAISPYIATGLGGIDISYDSGSVPQNDLYANGIGHADGNGNSEDLYA